MAIQDPDAALALARKAFQSNDLRQAEQIFRQVLTRQPANAGALYGLGAVALRAGRQGEAVRLIRSALHYGADRNPEAHITLGMAHLARGEHQKAVTAVEKGIQRAPDSARGYQALGEILMRAGEYRKALGAYGHALERNPDAAELLFALGQALLKLGHYHHARRKLEQANQRRPGHPDIRFFYARSLLLSDRTVQARAIFREMEALPQYRQLAGVNRAVCELFLDRPEQVLELWETLHDHITDAGLWRYLVTVRASALARLGREEEAAELCRQVLAEDAGFVDAWMVLGEMAGVSLTDKEFATLERLVKKGSGEDAVRLGFVYAWEHGKRECWREEMRALHRANAAHLALHPHDPEAAQRDEDASLALMDRGWYEQRQGHGTESVCPVFVVGMPRAGTTWTEQVLASHPEVGAAGESLAITLAIERVAQQWGTSRDEALRAPATELVPAFAEAYLAHTVERCGGEYEYFVDTVKSSYRYMGLLAAAFPRARFVLVSRNPMDICVECYRKLFRSEQSFTYDLYHCARSLMRLENSLAIQTRRFAVPVHRLAFEDLVGDFDRSSRALFDFVGLRPDESVLALHEDFVNPETCGEGPRLARSWLYQWRRYRDDEQVAALFDWLHEQGREPEDPAGSCPPQA